MKKKIILSIVLSLLVFGGSYRIYQHQTTKDIFSGTVEATLVDLSSQVNSRIELFRAKEGDSVEVGAPLVKLACEDIKVAFEQNRRDAERSQKLKKEGSLSQENYEHAQSRFQDSQVKMSWCDIVSPIKGTLLYTFKEKGELVLPGQKILSLADLDDLWSYVYLSSSEMKLVSLGKEFEAYLPQLDKKLKVKVIHINSQAEFTPKNVQTRQERERLVYGIKVKLEKTDYKIYPGMNLEVKIENE